MSNRPVIDHAQAGIDLLPPGRWATGKTSALYQIIAKISASFARVTNAGYDLLDQKNPHRAKSDGMLPDWEKLAGITPAPAASEAERQLSVITRITGTNNWVSRQGLIEFAANLGWTITDIDAVNAHTFIAGDEIGGLVQGDFMRQVLFISAAPASPATTLSSDALLSAIRAAAKSNVRVFLKNPS